MVQARHPSQQYFTMGVNRQFKMKNPHGVGPVHEPRGRPHPVSEARPAWGSETGVRNFHFSALQPKPLLGRGRGAEVTHMRSLAQQ